MNYWKSHPRSSWKALFFGDAIPDRNSYTFSLFKDKLGFLYLRIELKEDARRLTTQAFPQNIFDCVTSAGAQRRGRVEGVRQVHVLTVEDVWPNIWTLEDWITTNSNIKVGYSSEFLTKKYNEMTKGIRTLIEFMHFMLAH